MEFETVPRFFILQWIEKYLFQWGFADQTADLVTFLAGCLLVLLVLWLLNFVGTWVLTNVVSLAVRHSKTHWDDCLFKRHFFSRIIKCLTAALLLVSARMVFAGYNPIIISGIEIAVRIFIIAITALSVAAFINAGNDIYDLRPIAKQKSIKGILQTVKLVVYIIAGIIIVAILLRKDPTQLLVGLGASAAIMSLVFKDTILGFVASIQISAQDMIHPGDWIEMPSKNADGIVTDINVSNVKVRNWDNTVTMIPIYSLVSEAFTNWRNMEESGGRRFRRPLYFDVTSLAELTPGQIRTIEQHPYIAACADKMQRIFAETNTGKAVLNIALFRCYAEAYLGAHPKIATDQTLIVRYLPFDENGVKLELYGYSAEKRFAQYEAIVADMLNHLFVTAPLFGLKIYQRPSAAQSAVTASEADDSDHEPAK